MTRGGGPGRRGAGPTGNVVSFVSSSRDEGTGCSFLRFISFVQSPLSFVWREGDRGSY